MQFDPDDPVQREDHPFDSELPSLAQQIRGKQLTTARNILFFLAVLLAGTGALVLACADLIARQAVEQELGHEIGGRNNVPPEQNPELAEMKERSIRVVNLMGLIFAGTGLAYFLLGLFLKSFPVPITIIALAMFIAGNAVILATSHGELLLAPLYWGFLIGISMVLGKSIQSAIAYTREQQRSHRSRKRSFDDEEDD